MFQPWISKLKHFIKQLRGVQLQNHGGYAEHYSVQFTYKVSDSVKIEVDLLVSPYWERPQDFYTFLMTIPQENRMK